METGSERPKVKPKRQRASNEKGKNGERLARPCNESTLQLVLHWLANVTATATATATAAALAAATATPVHQ